MKFIDLFAGLGGFHVALNDLGHRCVFASEKKEQLAKLYSQNFNIEVNRDINDISPKDIPEFDILCAGFPCQPFSKAGDQKGLDDEKNGSLFDKIVNVLNEHNPQYFILENVKNIETHDNFNTWNYIKERLEKELKYTIDKKILSPHNFGIPQHRERLFIVGSKSNLKHFSWPTQTIKSQSVLNYLDREVSDEFTLEKEKTAVIDIWQEFINALPKDVKLPSFPIWSMEFGATYPYDDEIPFRCSQNKLGRTKGIFGVPLKGMSKSEKFKNLPNYAIRDQLDKNENPIPFPKWKINYIRKNREFYQTHEKLLKPIVKKIEKLGHSSWQKFEWNIQGGERNLKNYIIQFRGSGVRIKKSDFFPSLVTVSTQIPIIGWENRYITPHEGAKIQSLDGIHLPKNTGSCFAALGNAVNSSIVKLIAQSLVSEEAVIKNQAAAKVQEKSRVLV